MTTSFKPFPITESKTGLFNYLEPWIRPLDAFEPLQNAHVYRGSIRKRAGYSVFAYMTYQDTLANGNGGTTYSGTLQTIPIVPGTFTPTNGTESFTDNGLGVLTGSMGGSGTIDYLTGAWTLTFAANVASGVAITANYRPLNGRPIMGIKTWTSDTDGSKKLVVMDTRRAAVYTPTSQNLIPLNGISQIIFVGNGSTTSISVSTGWSSVVPYTNSLAPFSISITDGTSTITDDGAGNLSAAGNFAAGGTVNYSTGVITLNFTAAPASTVSITLNATLSGDYFTGNFSNFFNAINWMGQMYMTNAVDPITLYDGSTNPGTLSRPPFPITQANKSAFINNIGTCLDIDVYKNRLLVQRPVIINAGNQNGIAGQSIRWSAILNPTNLVADVSGNGGEESAPTDDFIRSSEFLRDQLIVLFDNTTWTFRYTGSDFSPFRWDKINSSKSTNAPYGTIDYDQRITAMGVKGLIACDGVNVQIYDLQIIDQFLRINQQAFAQCYGIRFDTLNQSWMLFPSEENNSPTSDRALIYNFIENTWAVYNIAMSCLGVFTVCCDKNWDDFAPNTPLGTQFPSWDLCDFNWNSYLLQGLAPTLLGGGFDGTVYQLNAGTTDNGAIIESSITSARWNPFTGIGQKVQFGWIDFYYEIDPDDTEPAVMTITFFTDNTTAPTTTRTLTMDGATNSYYSLKRVYINNVGEFLQMNMNSVSKANFKIIGMILWARPAGRFTP